MTRMVFVRHGESMGNLMKVMCGQYDVELTDKGRAQAALTAEYLKDWHFDAAYSSDLKRAYETCQILLKYHPEINIIRDEALRETYIGEWEHRPRAEIAEEYPEGFRLWANDIWNAHPDGGESVKECTKRVHDAVWRIARENAGRTVLIAGHAMIFRTLTCRWLNMPYEKMQDVAWVGNASVTVVDYDIENNTTKVVMLGENSFQGDMATSVMPFNELK